MQQLILGTGTAIWWLTEPHCQWGQYLSIQLVKSTLKAENKRIISQTDFSLHIHKLQP
jgi:hypothetical protein